MTVSRPSGLPEGDDGEDRRTLDAYDRGSASFADEWAAQPAPSDMYELLRRFFRPGPTADIGCGAGRDAAWLNDNGYPASGYDASDGLLREARRRHPDIPFHHAALPALMGVADNHFTDVLCETVIMHLDPGAVTPAVRKLVAILQPEGTLYLSWRLTEGSGVRDQHGRLYAAFDPAAVLAGLTETCRLFDETSVSASSGKAVRRIIARKPANAP
jgi:SAM-dependent methyltransferase